ncbi:ABC transporter permease [uncultured Ferrimonas sp.]|uniref:FtsX-like permease family protein n=1 Tax=uncultured Ferrimonas sp. TaxID=432640 RepID=UPI00263724F8|nr:ABC transporter permease [uncultured Ferrimonas sp.]
MNKLWWRLWLGEWRHHALLYTWLLLGLVLAAGLLSGVEVLNRAATSSFSEAEGNGSKVAAYRVHSLNPGYHIPHAFWLKLRLQGIAAEPVLIGRLQHANGDWLPVRGRSLPSVNGDNQWHTLATEQTAQRLGWQPQQLGTTTDQQSIPALKIVAGLGSWLWMDIAPAARLLGSGDKVSYLEIASLSSSQQQWLQNQLESDWQLQPQDQQQQQQQPLLAAFSMNLTALAILSFLVGILLAYHALASLVGHRRYRYQILLQLGITKNQLVQITALELVLLSAFAGITGSLLGVTLAQWLSPGVELTLTSLYQSESVFEIQWHWLYGAYCCGLMLLTLSLLLLGTITPWQRFYPYRFMVLVPLLALVVWLTVNASSQLQALLLSALTLLLAMLLIPTLLNGVVKRLQRAWPNAPVTVSWGLADLRQSRGSLTMALIAISLALATAIATRILTGSFAIALEQHLNQRLFAVAYIRGPSQQLTQWQPLLNQVEQLTDLKTLSQRRGESAGRTTAIKVVYSQMVPTDTFHFKDASTDWWQAASDGQCLINEPMALQRQLGLGESITVHSGAATITCDIAGIYYDYGNPSWEITLERSFAESVMPQLPLLGLGFKTAQMGYSQPLALQLEALGIPAAAIHWQQDLLKTARSMFNRTFAITDALAWLTLAVALISWLASLMAQRRIWAPTNALLATMGMTPRQLFAARIGQLTLLLSIVLTFSSLLGMVLGWQLLARVNPLTFGWSMPIYPLAGQWWLWIGVVMGLSLALALMPTRSSSHATGERV